jgi:hypothetical protein
MGVSVRGINADNTFLFFWRSIANVLDVLDKRSLVLPQASRADNLRSDKGRDCIERGGANPAVTFIEFMG